MQFNFNLSVHKYTMMLLFCIIGLLIFSCMMYKYYKNKETFVQVTGYSEKIMFFYADWCPHCTNFKPIVAEFKKQKENDPNLNVELINESTSRDKMKEYNIRGFPTIIYEKNGNRKEFNKERSLNGLEEFLVECRASF